MRYPKISDTPERFDHKGNKLCRNCDELIGKRRRNYCSRRCMNEFNRNNFWVFVRFDVLKRDNYQCTRCNKKYGRKQLDVDHIVPIKMGGEVFDKDNLQTLCKTCHKKKSLVDNRIIKKIK